MRQKSQDEQQERMEQRQEERQQLDGQQERERKLRQCGLALDTTVQGRRSKTKPGDRFPRIAGYVYWS